MYCDWDSYYLSGVVKEVNLKLLPLLPLSQFFIPLALSLRPFHLLDVVWYDCHLGTCGTFKSPSPSPLPFTLLGLLSTPSALLKILHDLFALLMKSCILEHYYSKDNYDYCIKPVRIADFVSTITFSLHISNKTYN